MEGGGVSRGKKIKIAACLKYGHKQTWMSTVTAVITQCFVYLLFIYLFICLSFYLFTKIINVGNHTIRARYHSVMFKVVAAAAANEARVSHVALSSPL